MKFECTELPDGSFLCKPVERGVGSGALTGFSDAKRAEEPGSAEEEERSDEPKSLAVSPGQAEAMLHDWKMRAASYRRRIEMFPGHKEVYAVKFATWEMAEVVFEVCIEEFERLLRYEPKPVSDARENVGDIKLGTDFAEAVKVANDGTASGRRNAIGHAPGAKATADE